MSGHPGRRSTGLLLDLFCLLFLCFLLALYLVGHSRIEKWATGFTWLVVGVGVYWMSMLLVRRRRGDAGRAAIRSVGVLALFAILFAAVAPLQHLVVPGWLDEYAIEFDRILFGGELSLILEGHTHPALTEWLMFCYVAYIPLLPLTSYLAYRHAGLDGVVGYLTILSLSYGSCYLGFIVFPLATQMHFMPQDYIVTLDGFWFTSAGEWIRTNLHAPGEALPSPHCAAATVMLVTIVRSHRPTAVIYVPIVLSLYVSTVYCRYHYFLDALTGIMVAVGVIALVPHVEALLHRSPSLTALHRFTQGIHKQGSG